MRKLGPGAARGLLRATVNLGVQVKTGSNSAEQPKTPSFWGKIWNERDVQIMVLISLALQLFLLFAGNVRRRRRLSGLKFFVWLAYLSSYAITVSAIGLFSQYENKYKLRSLESFEHLHTLTMPFLWAPFLLIHLGGPDTITAFSIEDNNLWTRQLINIAYQLSLALYVFWKSFDLLDSQLLAVAVPLYVAGIIKYGERIRALQRGSRDSLDCPVQNRFVDVKGIHTQPPLGDFVESRALKSALSGRGLLFGRKVLQLDSRHAGEVVHPFAINERTEAKLRFVLIKLGMIYDMLYTKVWVLHSVPGGVFRCIALVAMVVAFVLFWINQHPQTQGTSNAAITYMLFVAAFCMDVYSVVMLIASPWTTARCGEGTFLCWLSRKLAYLFPSQWLSSSSMGQFNLIDYSMSTVSRPKFISKVSEGFGLEKHWRNFWHVKHIEDKKIVNYIIRLSNYKRIQEKSQQQSETLVRSLLTLHFEHVLFYLHILTEMHLSTLASGGGCAEMTALGAACRKLSNYLMYLMAVYPSMLPVGSPAQDIIPSFIEWVRENHGNLTKAEILDMYADSKLNSEYRYIFPFEKEPSLKSLKGVKELWARLLIYAAGKCPMELHARQLGDGVDLLTVVGSQLIHCGIGDAGLINLDLLAPPKHVRLIEPNEQIIRNEQRSGVHTIQEIQRIYAFGFSEHTTLLLKLRANNEHNEQAPQQPPPQITSQPSTSRGPDVALEMEEEFIRRKKEKGKEMEQAGGHNG